jgi:membrane-bound lytic murein transglycosylase D
MKLRVLSLIVVLLTIAAPVIAQQSEFPTQGLEDRIEFWKKVYTQYGADDVIIHDRVHVNLIYDVATEFEVDSKIATVQKALNEIRSNLDTPEDLSIPAKQIREAIVANGIALSAETLTDLRENIHTQLGIKERFRDGVVRSGRYVDAFREIFEKEGLPTEVALLPLVESSFENRSLSKAGAAGLWQFTRGTGKLYLRVTRNLDERLDPPKATRAAARLLSANYKALGSWPLAITAYNHGRAGMLRAQDEIGSELTSIIANYRGKLFGYASMNFYSEFVAAVQVYNNYQQYFGELTLDTPSMRQGLEPRNAVNKPVQIAKATKPPTPNPSDKYKVRKGDTLWEIAQRFGVSARELMEMNNLRNSVIHSGQILLVK